MYFVIMAICLNVNIVVSNKKIAIVQQIPRRRGFLHWDHSWSLERNSQKCQTVMENPGLCGPVISLIKPISPPEYSTRSSTMTIVTSDGQIDTDLMKTNNVLDPQNQTHCLQCYTFRSKINWSNYLCDYIVYFIYLIIENF